MITVSTDSDNDIYIGPSGDVATVTALAATAETAEHYAATAQGEMIHAIDQGIPFFQTVFARDVSIAQFEAALRRRLLSSPGVLSVAQLDTVQDGEVLRYSATIETDYGQAVING